MRLYLVSSKGGTSAALLWGTLIISYVAVNQRKKEILSKLVSEGEYIRARLTGEGWNAVDRYNDMISNWISRVEISLTKDEYQLLCSNTGIEKPEDETINDAGDIGAIKNALAVNRNYMYIRILRLKEIINKL